MDAANTQVRILTHALPTPSTKGHCFPVILNQVHANLSPRRTTWISHWHAVSGRFNVAELPTTPPSTPGAPGVGDDYFTTRVFDSAVAVLDYQRGPNIPITHPGNSMQLQAAPTLSPRPAVPPSSVHISITERYIPPTTSSEFADIFDSLSGRSLLSDRLIELCDDSGLLVFIYPTQKGGRTFVKDYLCHVLDPLLRKMMVINELTADVCQEISSMQSVDHLPTFENMAARMEAFCAQLNSPDAFSSTKLHSTSSKTVKYTLLESCPKNIKLSPDVWTDWWTGQEKPRIRQVFDSFIRVHPGKGKASHQLNSISMSAASRLRDVSSQSGTAMSYIIDVIEGLKKAAEDRLQDPKEAIEVGFFVIRKQTDEGSVVVDNESGNTS
jgi:hypothetical protein